MERRASIGLVEDNDEDAYALGRACRRFAGIRRWTRADGLFRAVLDDPELLGSLDLLVLDLVLPGGVDGVHIAHTVRGAPGGAHLSIVLLTGSRAQNDRLRAQHADITAYENKPHTGADLHALALRLAELSRTGAARGGPAATGRLSARPDISP